MVAFKSILLLIGVLVFVGNATKMKGREQMKGKPFAAAVRKLLANARYVNNLIANKKREFQRRMSALEARITALESRPWTLKRVRYDFPGLKKVQLAPDAVTKRAIPDGILPSGTRAVLVSIKCDEWKESFAAKLSLEIKQSGNDLGGSAMYTAPMNDFYYETLVPWDGKAATEIAFKANGSSKNKYSLGIVGYITQ